MYYIGGGYIRYIVAEYTCYLLKLDCFNVAVQYTYILQEKIRNCFLEHC